MSMRAELNNKLIGPAQVPVSRNEPRQNDGSITGAIKDLVKEHPFPVVATLFTSSGFIASFFSKGGVVFCVTSILTGIGMFAYYIFSACGEVAESVQNLGEPAATTFKQKVA